MNASAQRELLTDQDNAICADCKLRRSEWASVNLGIFICIECSGIHRSLGTHISFVKSLKLDMWTEQNTQTMRSIGNRRSNNYYERHLPADFARPGRGDASRMAAFIRQKYIQRAWAPDSKCPSDMYCAGESLDCFDSCSSSTDDDKTMKKSGSAIVLSNRLANKSKKKKN